MPAYQVPTDTITIVQGDGFEYNLTVTDGSGPVDLTGADVWGGVKVADRPTEELVFFTVAITNAAAGQLRASLTSTETVLAVLGPRARYFYIKIQLPSEEPVTAVQGCVIWKAVDE